ncbi:uncharacterized protein TNCV_2350671 [Trichonephila clavipes]|uniref:Uncharacterized protein n=1 Tax=Trichonephila clavipes TaxID=2585209 RepID=A0A8X6SMH5_TRICX|nr:uncharacterized protein TNCV_2350671 [Trichonephila clavipes]
MSKQMVRRWSRPFSEGRQSVQDEERSGRPSFINDDLVELVWQRGIESEFGVNPILQSLSHEIVTKHLLFKNLSARWIPNTLTPEHKIYSLGAALTFLLRYHDDGDEVLDRIVTDDETWISHFTPEIKQQSMHWRDSGSLKGILLIDFLPHGETVKADHYFEALRIRRHTIQNKRRGMLTAELSSNIRPYNKMLRIILLISVGIVAANAIVCPHNYCDDVCCDDDIECSDDEILVEHGSFCGCCDVCRTIIREGKPCPLEFRGSPPTSQCEEGTTCKSTNKGRICVRNCYSK